MSSNVGLSTPRGSGTSGYVQRNMSFLRPRDNPPPRDLEQTLKYRQRAPDAEILAHDRKREVEVQCLQLQDQLEEDGCSSPLPSLLGVVADGEPVEKARRGGD